MCYNPHGYYYAPASLYFSQRSEDSDCGNNKRAKKFRRKSMERDNYYIFPTKIDNRMQLHAYPINEQHPSQLYANPGAESVEEHPDPVYVKKLEYSGDKVSCSNKLKGSA